MKVSFINPNPKNDEIYDQTDLSSLVKSISDNGLLEPLVVKSDGTLLSGHRRLAAVKILGWDEVEVRVVDVENEVIALIEYNRYRTKSEKDILRESRYLEKELRDQIGRGRNANKGRKGQKLRLDLELSKRLNVGTSKLKQLRSIENYQPQLIEDIEKGLISVSAAYKKVRSKFQSEKTTVEKNKFPQDLKGLLNTYRPPLSVLTTQIKQIYPYSLELTGITELERDELKEHLSYLVSLDSRELMLVQKQDELRDADFSKSQLRRARELLPTEDDIEEWWRDIVRFRVMKQGSNPLDAVEIISPDDGVLGFDNELWITLRTTISSFEYSSGPGRKMKFFIGFHKNDRFRLLGTTSFASDSQRLLVRDEYIGWDDLKRAKNREHIVNMNTCVATQPFGHNRLGMKFLCCLVPQMVKKWEQKYQTTIVGVVTTSLHGSSSAYQGMKWWKSLGVTSGVQILKPLRNEWSRWNSWLRDHYIDELNVISNQSSPLQSKLMFLLRCLDIDYKKFQHNHKRGVFFLPLYENCREFLRGEERQTKLRSVQIDWEDWWVNKSRKRYENIKLKNNVCKEQLFYENVEDLTNWLESRGFDV